MYSDIQAAIPLGFFLSFMIGPVFFVLLETAALKGFKAALVFDLGVILADIIFISAAYFRDSMDLVRPGSLEASWLRKLISKGAL